MQEELPYEKALQRYLSDELRVVNAHLPQHRKLLSELLNEEYPHVLCGDGSVHFHYLSNLLLISMRFIGLTLFPLSLMPKWRWGPVTLPEEPDCPRVVHFSTT